MSGELIRPSGPRFTRRRLLIGLGLGAAAAPLSGCDSGSPTALRILEKAEGLTKAAQRALLGPQTAMARGIFARRDLALVQAERLDRSSTIPPMSRCATAASRTGSSKSAAWSSGR